MATVMAMGRYDAHKNPLQQALNHWGYRRINENLEQLMKSVPAHVVKTEKDFLHVALDLKDA